MTYTGPLRSLGLAKETTLNTPVTTPTRWLAYVPPETFSPQIPLVESKGVRAVPDMPVKSAQGAAKISGAKLKIELEPENIGEILQALAGSDTYTGSVGYGTHVFKRQAVDVLPSYTFLIDKGPSWYSVAGALLNKFTLDVKQGAEALVETEWEAMSFATASSKTPSYSALPLLTFANSQIRIAGSDANDYDDFKLTIDNMVKAGHVVGPSNYPQKIWSEGMKTSVSLDYYLEGTTEYAKFLAGTSSSVQIALTGGTIPTTAVNYSLTWLIPVGKYATAPLSNPTGVLKIPFAATAHYDLGSTNESWVATLVNGVESQY